MRVALCEKADWAIYFPRERHARGTASDLSRGELLAQNWFDSKEVNFLSTMHCGKYPSDVAAVNHTVRRRSDAIPIDGPTPPLLHYYYRYMGGVDLADNILKHYSIRRKTVHAYRRIINHGIKFL